MGTLMDVIRAIRNIRAEMNVPLGRRADVVIQAADEGTLQLILAHRDYLGSLAGVAELTVLAVQSEKPRQAGSAILPGVEIYVPLRGLVDFDREVARLRRSLAETVQELERASGRLANPSFVARAPAPVVAREREREAELKEAQEKLERRLATFVGS